MKTRRRDQLVIVFAIAATTATTLPVFLAGALEPVLVRSIGLRPELEGLAVGSFFLAGVVGAVGVARSLHRVPAGALVRAAAMLSSMASAAVALVVRNPPAFVVALVAAGIANGILQPGVNEILARTVHVGRRGWAFGVKQAAIPAATLLAGLALPLIALRSSWRLAYAAAGLLAFVIAVLGAPKVQGGFSARPPGAFHPPRALFTVVAAMALGAGSANALGAFGVASLVHDGIPAAIAGYLAALGSAAGLATRLGMGWISDRHLERPLRWVGGMLALGAVGYLGLASGVRPVLLAALLVGYAGGWGWNGLVNFAASRVWPHHTGQATGLVQAGAFAGSVIGPIGFGLVVRTAGFHVAWVVGALAAVLAAAGMTLGSRLLEARATGGVEPSEPGGS